MIKRIQTKNNIVQLQNKVLDTQTLYRERKRERKRERVLSISIVHIHTYKKKLTPLNWPYNSEPTSSLHKHQNQHKRFLLFSLSLSLSLRHTHTHTETHKKPNFPFSFSSINKHSIYSFHWFRFSKKKLHVVVVVRWPIIQLRHRQPTTLFLAHHHQTTCRGLKRRRQILRILRRPRISFRRPP